MKRQAYKVTTRNMINGAEYTRVIFQINAMQAIASGARSARLLHGARQTRAVSVSLASAQEIKEHFAAMLVSGALCADDVAHGLQRYL